MFRISEEDQKHIVDVSRHLCRTGELARTRDFIQHGHTTVYTHVHHVARIALWLNRKLNLKADRDRVIRSALLHDYFLYDWHDKSHDHPRPHGFHHPKVAMEAAHRHYELHPREQDAIVSHMFPLTKPPRHREGWLVTAADKLSTFQELSAWWRRKLRPGKLGQLDSRVRKKGNSR
ncbi:HD domain-containing protein [Faecalibaculum rodentium]|uniref:HD domain-containing protein n=2 Tax=Faecalibaculum rodentium TaxID=1702221 RepID=A0A140DXT5_9FIRM|nr:HD domain-containing protein [Faecalibaculum rodentium]AMK55462.1 hypothetical protein AALO17_23280 [Faecalibaculum rodentium]OLU47450.1 hypothetical protein BO223_00310 [Faecalibaculum rodentium]